MGNFWWEYFLVCSGDNLEFKTRLTASVKGLEWMKMVSLLYTPYFLVLVAKMAEIRSFNCMWEEMSTPLHTCQLYI